MSDFKILKQWLPPAGTSEWDVTMCNLTIKIGATTVTSYVGQHQPDSEFLQIPVYDLAEWIAENWWALLYEPHKSEQIAEFERNADYSTRHSFLAAQHGFILPRVFLVPTGENIDLFASKHVSPFSDVKFINNAHAILPRRVVQSELRGFVSAVVQRLAEQNKSETDLQIFWDLIERTSDDELIFCQLMGALGLSPYEENKHIEPALANIVETLGEQLAMDICLAATQEDFGTTVSLASRAVAIARASSVFKLSKLLEFSPVAENFSLPAWRRGVQSANRVRERLNISENDPNGGTKFLDILGIDTKTVSKDPSLDNDLLPVTAAIVRNDETARAGLTQYRETQRRFAASRAVYAAWTTGTSSAARLLTQSVTRDQQANRAFAAEMMAPKALLRRRATRSRLSYHEIQDLAEELAIGADVVRNQAVNNGLQVYAA
jgi:hypothetical protein